MTNGYAVTPQPHNVKDKHDVIDWQHLPPGRCDMNYRLPSAGGGGAALPAALGLAMIACLATVLYLGLLATSPSWAHLLLSWPFLTGTPIFAGLAVLVFHREAADRRVGAVLAAALLVVVGLLLIAAGWLALPERIGLLVLAAPLLLGWAADSVALYGVHWLTAHPRIAADTMNGWRADWQRRWLGMSDRLPAREDVTESQRRRHRAAMQNRRAYRAGPLWLAAALVGGAIAGLLVAAVAGTSLIALPILLEITLALALAAWLRCRANWRQALAQVLQTLAQFWHDEPAVRMPPWVWQSPVGPRRVRKLLIALIVGVTAFLTTAAVGADRIAGGGAMVPLLLTLGSGLLAPLWLLLSMLVLAGPALAAHYDALEAPGAYEQQPDQTEWDGYVARLQGSGIPHERNANWIGCHLLHRYPVLVDRKLRFEHTHIVGGSGTGKTALSLATDVIQAIRRPRGAVVVLDCKGDPALLHLAKEEAAKRGRNFKWFTNMPYRSTYVFNPLTQLRDARLSLSEIVAVVAQSLSLYHGEGYGKGYFGAGARALMKAAFKMSAGYGGPAASRPPIESLFDLEEALREVCGSPDEYQAAKHLSYVLDQLIEFKQVNFAPGRDFDDPAIQGAIHLPTAIEQGEVIYFYLMGAMDLSSVGHLARLAMYSTLAAAQQYRFRTGERPEVELIADEAQCLITQNLQPILEQARSYGVACTLAHQNHSQLVQSDANLLDLVLNNTAVKRYHSVRDPVVQKYVAHASGRTAYYDLSWDQFKHRVVSEEIVSPRYACSGPDGRMRMGVQMGVGDRLEPEDQNDMNRRMEQCAVLLERSEGLTQYNGGFVMQTDWPVDEATYARREAEDWPGDDPAGGDLSSELIRATTHPQVDLEVDASRLDERLRAVRSKLLGVDVEEDAGESPTPQ